MVRETPGYQAKATPKGDLGGGGEDMLSSFMRMLAETLFPGPAPAQGGANTTTMGMDPFQQGGPPVDQGQPQAMMMQPTDTLYAEPTGVRPPTRNPAFASDAAAFGPGFNNIDTGLPPVGPSLGGLLRQAPPPMPEPNPMLNQAADRQAPAKKKKKTPPTPSRK